MWYNLSMETMNVTVTSNTEMIQISRAEYEEYQAQKNYIAELETKLNWLMEQFRLNQHRRFGASSERSSEEVMEQMSLLFNEAEVLAAAQPETVKTSVIRAHTRKRRSGSLRDIVPENITVEEVRHELPAEKRQCPKCGEIMEEIGIEAVETLELIPAKAVIHRDVYVHYACQQCTAKETEVPMLEAPKEKSLMPGGFASPKAVAYIMVQKFVMYAPLYRQEQDWNRRGLMLSRQTMSEWVLFGAELLVIVYEELHRLLLCANILHADETTLQVLQEAGKAAKSRSYIWLYMTGAAEEHQIVLYEYKPGRNSEYPRAFLSGFQGYLQTDGYSGYHDLKNVVPVGCWAHMRRKFDEAVKALPKGEKKKTGAAATGLAYCTGTPVSGSSASGALAETLGTVKAFAG